MKNFVLVLALVVGGSSVQAESSMCLSLFLNDPPAVALQSQVNGRNMLYEPIFSKDQDILNTFKFDEGPTPQKNVSIPPERKDQYVFTPESPAIFRQKQKLTRANPDKVIQYLGGHGDHVLAAVREQFDRMLAEFGADHPEVYEVNGDSITNKLTGDVVTRKQVMREKDPYYAIELVGKLVQDDWLMMRKNPETNEYELIGGYLAFPTHWSLDRAIGWTLAEIHKDIPIPQMARDQLVKVIGMMLDRSLADPDRIIVRNNWFVESDPRYALPDYMRTKSKTTTEIAEILISGKGRELLKDLVCMRVERQTLRGLPQSGVVIFSINPYVFKLRTVLENPEVVAKVRRGLEQKFPGASADQLTNMIKEILDAQMAPPKIRRDAEEDADEQFRQSLLGGPA